MYIQVFLEHDTIPSVLFGILMASKLHHMSFFYKTQAWQYYDGDFFKMRQSVGGDIFRVCKVCCLSQILWCAHYKQWLQSPCRDTSQPTAWAKDFTIFSKSGGVCKNLFLSVNGTIMLGDLLNTRRCWYGMREGVWKNQRILDDIYQHNIMNNLKKNVPQIQF